MPVRAAAEPRVAGMLGALRRSHYRLTTQRRLVCEALSELAGHPTAYEVYARVTPRAPSLSLATVYATLRALTQTGAIFDLGSAGGGPARYEVNPEPHANFVCTVCGRVEDVFDVPVGELRDGVVRRGHLVRGLRVVLYGTCATCQSRLRMRVSHN
ncbi:MAG: transcriptional repressor [Actinobacteria bacterium]|nr:transcriptional repressor [Actinomycetota bacterium]